MAAEVASAFVSIMPSAKGFGSKLDGQLSPEVNRSGSKMGKVLGGAMVAGLAIGGAAIGKFTVDAAKLDTKMREVVTLFGETGKAADRSLGQVRSQVRDLSNQFGIAQETLTAGLYSAISAGVPRENAFTFMQVASKAAIAGVTDVETSVDGISSTINAFGLSAKDAMRVSDSMFAAVKGGKTTFAELSASLFNIAPAAAAAGVSFQEVNAGIATLTAGGTPTSVATTQMRAALTGLQRPSEDLNKIFQGLGYESAQVAIESKGLGFALDAVKDASKGNNGELQKLLGSSEAVAAANVLAGTGAKKFTDELKRQKTAAGSTNDAFNVVNKGAERQFAIFQNRMRNLGLSIGQAILPIVNRVLPKISKFVVGLQDGTGAGGKFASAMGKIKDIGAGLWNAFDAIPGWLKKVLVAGVIGGTVAVKVSNVAQSAAGGVSKALGKGIVQRVFETNPAALGGGVGGVPGAGGKPGKPKFGGAKVTAGALLATLGIGFLADGINKQRPGGDLKNSSVGGGSSRGNIGSEAKRFDNLFGGKRVELPGLDKIKAEIGNIVALASKIPPKVQTEISAPGALKTTGDVLALAKKYKLTPKQVETLMRAKDFATKDIKKVQRELKATDKQKTVPQIRSDVREAIRKAMDVRRWLGIVDRTKTNPKINVSTGQSMAELAALKGRMDSIRSKSVTINVRRIGGNAPLLDGERALGGPVKAGGIYKVGERGEELFSPGVDGHIIPNHKIKTSVPVSAGAGGGGSNTFHLYDFDGQLMGTMRGVAVQTSDVMAAHDYRMGRD